MTTALHALLACACAASLVAAFVPIHQHSLEPPLLANYDDSGLPFWTFGGTTVITNDFVRLTPKTTPGRGYLWNRHPAELKSFSVNFTVRATGQGHFHLFGKSSCTTCGAAWWHVEDASRHGAFNFFGMPPSFKGFGVVVPTTGNLHLVQGDGSTAYSIEQVSVGQCAFVLDETPRVITVTYDGNTDLVNVRYAPAANPTYQVPCITRANLRGVRSRFYFGFTAYAQEPEAIGVDVLSMSTTASLGNADESNNANVNPLFDVNEEKKDRLLWDGKPDKPQRDDAKAIRPAEQSTPLDRAESGGDLEP